MMAPLLTWKSLSLILSAFFDGVTNHRVVGLSVVVESDLVKGPTTGLPSNVLLYHLHIS